MRMPILPRVSALVALLAIASPAHAQSPTDATSATSAPDAIVLASLAPRVQRTNAWATPAPFALERDVPADSGRRKAVSYSDWYARRLTVHRYGSYVMLPLFAAEFVLGNRLLNQKRALYSGTSFTPVSASLRTTHAVVAGGVGTVFAVNTTTGLWNLFEARHDENGRTRRTVHAIAMLAADAGFAYTGVLGSRAKNHGLDEANAHRNAGLASMGVATAGVAYMWFTR